ncbi:DegT/DnrJ/EryC1/StrS family aminotransferase [Robertkochia aurantiaca]|uniref:DegT/DnrJ/EryC1/StrS family aminotransferase n=1 Tax=Robertkochia aurantiaca TaxID=2873700 RepID=UPI001CCC95E2|nr:DegT/DnrJ/EryC1/StrS family aminotransferase [Robertkochia sp. 3YJGBD-33]
MKIDFASLDKSYLENKVEIDNITTDIFSNAQFILGEQTSQLEESLKNYVGSEYALGCASGTDALILALMALNIGADDEVITTPFTFIATAEAIAFLGAKPVFVDIDPRTYNIDPNKIEKSITSRTKAIIPVSLYGQISDMDAINKIAKDNGLFVIEDAAQSFGATYRGRRSCGLSTIACTSFFPAKPLGCFGDGGAVFTSDRLLYEKMHALRVHGQTKRYIHKYIGIGGRLDNLQAGILNIKLKNYEKDIERRQKVANWYSNELADIVTTPYLQEFNTSVYAQYTIEVDNREELQDFLAQNGIPTAVHYPIPLHLQECFQYLSYEKGDFLVSEQKSKTVLSLPMNPYLFEEEVQYICDIIKKFIQ